MGGPHDITVRKIEFAFPERLDPLGVVEGHPEESLVNVGLSLLLPYLEPYLIRTMRQAKAEVTDEGLSADIDSFNGQEGQHYRQHRKFNDVVRDNGFDRLEAFEERLSRDYRRFTEEKSLRFNLAYAEGFEAYTAAFALFSLEHGIVDRFHPAAKDLFLWHLVEELEHRTVAFDVYDHVCGSYLYRLFVGLYAQWHMSRWIFDVTRYMLKTQQKRIDEEFDGKKGARARTLPLLWLQIRHLLPKILKTYLPWYTPRRIELPRSVFDLADHYAQVARRPAT